MAVAAAFLFIAFSFVCPLETSRLISPAVVPSKPRRGARSGFAVALRQPRNPFFYVQLGTIPDDNQRNTCPKVRLLKGGDFAVISSWDESVPGFEVHVCYEIRTTLGNKGDGALATISRDEILVRSQSVVARVVAGETLIVPVRARVGDLASIYSFNGTGTLIWKLLESPRTVAELAAAVAREYEVEAAQAESDVTNFVGEMKVVGLVEVPASVAMAGD
jgi:Coenzyme PQQ synthesis protein D (PqqD)